MADDVYCADASSLIKLKQDFRRSVFPTLWEKVEELIRADRLIAANEVLEEIKKDDVLAPWAKKHKKMFRKLDQKQVELAREVATQFPELANPGRFGPAADPFVVALARAQGQDLSGLLLPSASPCVVVTEERGPNKIPGACKHYGLTCITLLDLFEREGWKF
ncbi:MAG TPA: DUF4411 family protein [Candidatus Acidoferrales bacterium]|jgi:hypothetical protein|nr:DUF4411 family protein [Candidatus Acidoferrales bacterium]